jgi:hypothetical protein
MDLEIKFNNWIRSNSETTRKYQIENGHCLVGKNTRISQPGGNSYIPLGTRFAFINGAQANMAATQWYERHRAWMRFNKPR